MSTRWWIAGSLLAALAFVDVLGDSSRFLGLPAIAGATVAAASVLFAVRLYETLFRAVRWIVRKIGVWAGWAT